jgi:radical SAM superfamily enzyme with C-terminal helix-hairpin-helix motif
MRKIALLIAGLMFALALPVTAQTAKPLDPNSATQAQIAAVPGLAPLAADIVAKRPYTSPSAFAAALSSLTPEARGQVFTQVWVPMNLNTATPDDIMLVPGMSRRMMNEFREYRPYRSIEQFRFEIGKYVSKEEVARFERYVFVPAK